MDVLPKFVDMARSPAEVKKEAPVSLPQAPQNIYPYGLCISLCQEELDKLGLDGDVDSGDMVHLHAMGKVTSVIKRDTDQGQDNRIEIQLTAIAVEDESKENEAAEQEMDAPRKVKNPYKK